MSVSPFRRKAVLPFSLMVFTLLFSMGNTDALSAGNPALGSGVINAPSVRMKVNKVFLPLDNSEDDNAKLKNSTSRQALKPVAKSNIKKSTEQDSVKAGNRKASAITVTGKNIKEKKAQAHKKTQKPRENIAAKSEKKINSAHKNKNVRNKVANKKAAHGKKHIGKADAGQVKGLEFDADGNTFKAEVLLSRSPGKVSWFNLKKPERLVVDLRGSWEGRVRSKHKLKNGPVRTVVVGEHSDRLRLVFYMQKGFSTAGLKPQIKKMSKKLGISFKVDQ